MPANPLKQFGNLFQHETLADDIRWLYDIPFDRLIEALSTARLNTSSKKNYPYHIGYITGAGINAAAWHVKPAGCAVCIYSSTPLLVYMACMQVAALYDSRTAQPLSTGDQLIVQPQRKRLKYRFDQAIKTGEDVRQTLDAFDLKKHANRPFGYLLTEIALKFIAMHECMHVILGHTRYLEEHCGLDSLLEFSNALKGNTTLSQTLEFIADRNALRGLYVRLMEGDFDDFHHKGLMQEIDVPKNVFLMRSLIIACSVLFHLFPNNDKNIYDKTLSHPHPYIRARFMCNELIQEADKYMEDAHEPLSAMAWAAAHLSSNFIANGNWEKSSFQDLDEPTKAVRSDEYYYTLSARAQELQPYITHRYGVTY